MAIVHQLPTPPTVTPAYSESQGGVENTSTPANLVSYTFNRNDRRY
jgi:hypothetical protein